MPGGEHTAWAGRHWPHSDLVRELLAESIAALGMQALPRTRPEFRTFAAGPGWADVELPPRVVLLTSLLQATDLIGAAIL